jgi:hypothetical protein
VPQHLPADLKTKSVRLLAGPPLHGESDQSAQASFDSVWTTGAGPDTNYCADLEGQLKPKP